MMLGEFDTDDDFAREYRDYKLDDLVNYIALWADRSYATNMNYPEDVVQPKRAPFYSMTELHMIPTDGRRPLQPVLRRLDRLPVPRESTSTPCRKPP